MVTQSSALMVVVTGFHVLLQSVATTSWTASKSGTIRPTTKAYVTDVLLNFSKMAKDRLLQVGTNKLEKTLNEASGASLFCLNHSTSLYRDGCGRVR